MKPTNDTPDWFAYEVIDLWITSESKTFWTATPFDKGKKDKLPSIIGWPQPNIYFWKGQTHMPSFHSPTLAMHVHSEEDCPFLAPNMDIHSTVQENWNAISHHPKERRRPIITCDPLKFFTHIQEFFVQSDLSEVG